MARIADRAYILAQRIAESDTRLGKLSLILSVLTVQDFVGNSAIKGGRCSSSLGDFASPDGT